MRNTVDTWHGIWEEFFRVDTFGITEDEVSIRLFGSSFRGGLDILYATYWDKEFHLDTSRTCMLWKDITFETSKICATLGDFTPLLGRGLS